MAVPIRTRRSNFCYLGPANSDIGDAWVERRPAEGSVFLEWEPTEEERAAIAAGGLIRVGIHGLEPIPPTSVTVVEPMPLSQEGAELRDRALRELRRVSTSGDVPAGWWNVTPAILERLTKSGAVDAEDDPATGIPTLFARPLMMLSEPLAFPDFEYHVDGRHPHLRSVQ